MTLKTFIIRFFTLLFSLFITGTIHSQSTDIQKALQLRIESGLEEGGLRVGDIYLFNGDSLVSYYVKRKFRPVWSDEINRKDLIAVLNAAYDEGLEPADYHLDKLNQLLKQAKNGKTTLEDQVDLELLMSDAISLYIYHLNYGKVKQSSLREAWNVPDNPLPENPDEKVEAALNSHSLPTLIAHIPPQHFMYQELKKGLKKYRQIESEGGWPSIPDGETIKPGMTDKRVIILRKYLMITKDLANENSDNPELFDVELENAVKHFQFRHGMTQDGVIGKGTLKEMNVTVSERIDQIRINMERSRWIMHELENDFLVVNIAGFNMRRVTNDSIVYFSPVIVGKPLHETPIFKASMQYFVINPTWTVPYSIATNETLPKLKKDPNYLSAHNMIITDKNGVKLDPASIDFSKYSKGNFPFTIVQQPGPDNALGEVKFIFPNPYSVYVHDTPSRGLFSKEDRAFSHGCIRLQNKWQLALSLMNDPSVWNMEKINSILASDETTTVHLKNPIDILILYWTAGADKESRLFFNKDVYNRDQAVFTELNKPWKFKSVN